MGSVSSQTQRSIQSVFMSNEVSNVVSTYMENNTKYLTRSEQNISQTLENINISETEQNNTTSLDHSTAVVISQEMSNAIKNVTLEILNSSDVVISQSNNYVMDLTAVADFDLKTINSSNIVLNNDANVVSDFLSSTTAQNEAILSMTADTDISATVDNACAQTTALENSQEETDATDCITKMISSLTNLFSASNQSQDFESYQDVRNIVENIVENKDINNIESVSETLLNAMYSFHNENQVQTYINNLSAYADNFSTTVAMDMSNLIENSKIVIDNATNITINQTNYAKQQLYIQALTTVTTDNSFGSTTGNTTESVSKVINYLESKSSTTSDMAATTSTSTDVTNTATQEATGSNSSSKTSISIVTIIVCVVVIGIVGYFIYKAYVKNNKEKKSKNNKSDQEAIQNTDFSENSLGIPSILDKITQLSEGGLNYYNQQNPKTKASEEEVEFPQNRTPVQNPNVTTDVTTDATTDVTTDATTDATTPVASNDKNIKNIRDKGKFFAICSKFFTVVDWTNQPNEIKENILGETKTNSITGEKTKEKTDSATLMERGKNVCDKYKITDKIMNTISAHEEDIAELIIDAIPAIPSVAKPVIKPILTNIISSVLSNADDIIDVVSRQMKNIQAIPMVGEQIEQFKPLIDDCIYSLFYYQINKHYKEAQEIYNKQSTDLI